MATAERPAGYFDGKDWRYPFTHDGIDIFEIVPSTWKWNCRFCRAYQNIHYPLNESGVSRMNAIFNLEILARQHLIRTHPDEREVQASYAELKRLQKILTKCDGDHAKTTPCIDPKCWHKE